VNASLSDCHPPRGLSSLAHIRVLEGEKMAVVCREFDTSRKNGCKLGGNRLPSQLARTCSKPQCTRLYCHRPGTTSQEFVRNG
jgi:hypothetical protein